MSAKLTQQLNLLNQSQLLALQSQINPHFLFNTLNMIYTCECVELGYQHELPGITLSLSRLLRYAFQSTDLVSLDTELEFTKIYLELMRRRYINRFSVIYDVSTEALSASVPKLFIQPIVENAIFHGLVDCHKEDPCLHIVIRSADGYCTVKVVDNGSGMDEAALKKLSGIADEPLPTGTGIGVKNVVTRMRLLLLSVACWFVPLLSRYDQSIFKLLKASLFLTVRRIFATLGSIILLLLAVLAASYEPLLLVFVPGLAMLLLSFLQEPGLQSIYEKSEADAEQDTWYLE